MSFLRIGKFPISKNNQNNVDQDPGMLRVIVSWVQDSHTIAFQTQEIPREPPKGGRWIDFDILPALEVWSNSAKHDYGLFIIVQRMTTIIPVHYVIQEMNCSKTHSNLHHHRLVYTSLCESIDPKVQKHNIKL